MIKLPRGKELTTAPRITPMYDTLKRTNGQVNIFLNNEHNNYQLIEYSLNTILRISGWGMTEINHMDSANLRLRTGKIFLERQQLLTLPDPRINPNPTNIQSPIDWRLLIGDTRRGSWGCRGDSGGKLY